MWRYNLRTLEGQGLTKNFIIEAAELDIISCETASHLCTMLHLICISSVPDSHLIETIGLACEGIETKAKDALAESFAHTDLCREDVKAALIPIRAALIAIREAQEKLNKAQQTWSEADDILLRAHGRNEDLGDLLKED